MNALQQLELRQNQQTQQNQNQQVNLLAQQQVQQQQPQPQAQQTAQPSNPPPNIFPQQQPQQQPIAVPQQQVQPTPPFTAGPPPFLQQHQFQQQPQQQPPQHFFQQQQFQQFPQHPGQHPVPVAIPFQQPQQQFFMQPPPTQVLDVKAQVRAQTRWVDPLNADAVSTFATQYMPWVRPRIYPVTEDSPIPKNIKSGDNELSQDVNPLKKNDFLLIEQSAQYKELVRKNPAAAAAMKAGVKCPDRLAIYIERAFSKCIDDGERDFMKTQLERICTASKDRGDFFIKQWELMPLPCLQRESVSFTLMNERLVRGDSNTTVPYPQQLQHSDEGPQQQRFSQQGGTGVGSLSRQSSLLVNTPIEPAKPGAANQNRFLFQQPAGATNIQPSSKPFTQFTELNLQRQHSGSGQKVTNGRERDLSAGQPHNSAGRFEKNLDRSAASCTPLNFTSPSHVSQFLNSSTKLGGGVSGGPGSSAADLEMYKRLKRLEKFEQQQQQKASQGKPKNSHQRQYSDDSDEEQQNHIKGTCREIEKPYFRLTSAPDPSDVRPEYILIETLAILKKKWEKKTADYKYIDDQFRSLRQDLTVQHIQNDFSVQVYETHARIALENADLDQFNQCQTQLRYLYELGNRRTNKPEFLAYQLLYYVFCELITQTNSTIKSLTSEDKAEAPVAHALAIRKALAMGNYSRFFKLYRTAPNMTGALIDVFIDKLRILCLQKLTLAFMFTNIDLGYLQRSLAFDSVHDLKAFLTEFKLDLIEENYQSESERKLDCRQSNKVLQKAPLKVRRCKK